MNAGHLPIVYLPGASGGSAIFRGIAARLERRRPSVLVDYPGLGSEPPDSNIATTDDLAGWVA